MSSRGAVSVTTWLNPITRRASHWLSRWEEVDRVTPQDARRLTPEEKFRQFETLVESADLFEWPDETAEDTRIRELWMRLHMLHPMLMHPARTRTAHERT